MPHAYTEDQLVEQPAIGLFAELGWQTVSAFRYLRRTHDLLLPRLLSGQIAIISLRVFRETHVKRHEEAAKGTGLRTFGVDIQQDLLRAVTGVPEDPSFAARVSGADSLAIDVELDFGDLAGKCKELLKAYNAGEYAQRGFDWIDNMRVVRSTAVINQLDNALVAALKAKDKDIQMLCPDNVRRDSIRGFLYQEEKANAQKHTELEMDEWQNVAAAALPKLTVDALHARTIRLFDEHGTKIGEIPDRDCFVFETHIQAIKYILSNGEWFEVATSFDSKITKYINSISKNPVPLPDFQSTWNHASGAKALKGEDRYVAEAAKTADLMSMHKKTCSVEGSAIEPCDLLHRSGALVHVKVWSQSATFSHLLAQGAVSAESLLRFPTFRDHVAASAAKHKGEIRKLFPTDSFVTSKLDVVLALVRSTSAPLPFFSRLNLMREGQRIERLGYRVNYHRIDVK